MREVLVPPLQDPPQPGLELLARFTVELGAAVWDLGRTTELGTRRIVPIVGGRFVGPRLAGEILDNGADWQVITDDGTTVVDTRYLLRLDDGALAYLRTRGSATDRPRFPRGSRRVRSSTRTCTTSACR
jgi:hypothetical protein